MVGYGFDDGIEVGVLWLGIRRAGRQTLVQLRHVAAQRAGFFHQLDVVTRLGGFQRRGHAGDAAADDQYVFVQLLLTRSMRDAHVLGLGTGHADVVISHFLCGFLRFVGFWTNPDDAFAQIGARQGDIVEAEGFDLGATRASADHDVIGFAIVDVFLNHFHPGF